MSSAAISPVTPHLTRPPTYPTCGPPSRPPAAPPATYSPAIAAPSSRSARALIDRDAAHRRRHAAACRHRVKRADLDRLRSVARRTARRNERQWFTIRDGFVVDAHGTNQTRRVDAQAARERLEISARHECAA